MNHPDLTKNHVLENWVFPNATARQATGNYQTYDIGKIAYQQDNGSYWRLVSTSPNWASIQAALNNVSAMPVNPGAITSTAGVMAGLGVIITPTRTGRVLVIVTGSVSNSLASDGSKMEIRFAGGAAPGFGTAPAGSAVGKAVNAINNPNTATLRMPFTLSGVITGMGIGVAYWIDLAVTAITAGTVNLYDLTVTGVEI